MLNERIGDLAQELLGKPNSALSTRSQLRFGRKGSVAIELDGEKRGQWFDHENGVGGDAMALVCNELGLANSAACAWAVDWLGLDSDNAIRVVSPMLQPAADQQGKAAGGDDTARVAKVAAIVGECSDPATTPAELYLRNRGITATPLPPSLRYRPNAHGRYGALVALATDANGNVNAVQQIYVSDDGGKAPVKVQKRTNKGRDDWSDTSAVRLPGEPPIILCEGVETALSVWRATGQESWACLGISNIARTPVSEGAAVIVARDGDAPGSKAEIQLRHAVTILRQRGCQVAVAEPPTGKDFNDVLVEGGEDAVRDLIAAAVNADLYSTEWRAGLLRNSEGAPRAILANAIHALREAPEWQDVLWHNEFATSTVARRPPPWAYGTKDWEDTPWSDRDDYLVAEWLQQQGIMVPASIAGQAVETVARDQTFHPVREYLDAQRWDGRPRLDTWLISYLGAPDTPYVRAIGPRWLMSAVARVFIPGAKADCALILEGPQGIKKSTALSVMAQPWFTDRLSDLGSKDAAMETKGVWIIEIAELDTMSRAEVSAIKAFMSRTHDRFRPPYGKRLVDLPRQCVFAGSINPEGGYLKDATGGRRFWPVVCGQIDVGALTRDRDQLWAEARDRFRKGEAWWLETPELNSCASEEQADRYQGDAWEEPIRTWLENEIEWMENGFAGRTPYRSPRPEPLTEVTVGEILEKALGVEKG
ncbi:MAG TPA: VapE domain-containing protein, partial [Rhodospirillales bacterium]|nr:VapE domain-containing protein [Rhodospirillales bacterium]